MEKKFLTETEVAVEYGLGVRHLREMRGKNIGPRFYKTSGRLNHRGGRVTYRPSDVEQWILSQQCGGDPAKGTRA